MCHTVVQFLLLSSWAYYDGVSWILIGGIGFPQSRLRRSERGVCISWWRRERKCDILLTLHCVTRRRPFWLHTDPFIEFVTHNERGVSIFCMRRQMGTSLVLGLTLPAHSPQVTLRCWLFWFFVLFWFYSFPAEVEIPVKDQIRVMSMPAGLIIDM